jgi:predicted nucleotidyltransferase
MQTPDLNILPSIFKKYPDIEAVYLFGSMASGRIHTESDLDLAILPKTESIKNKKLEILGDLTQHGFDAVDLIFIDGTDLVLDYEAVRLNKVVYATGNFSKGATYSRIVRKYLDFLPYLEVQRKALKARILNGQS